jgi:hypothetical protein
MQENDRDTTVFDGSSAQTLRENRLRKADSFAGKPAAACD